jgi:hypothetical protein
MKRIFLSTLLILFAFCGYSQSGVYQSKKFEFISENTPSRNRVETKNNTLTFQINESNGEFISGKILWEMKSNSGNAEILEMSLKRIKNSYFEETVNAFIKIYAADIIINSQIVDQIDVYIWKFVANNTFRVDMVDSKQKTINRFDNIVKL